MNKNDYNKTPSFYNTQEVFEKYLGQSSYYNALQRNVVKLCMLSKCKRILELGCATGATSITLAKAIPSANIIGLDMRDNVIKVAEQQARIHNVKNLDFVVSNFCNYPKYSAYDFIVMLYSFHHIEDPETNKIKFLSKIYNQVKKNTYLCIAETFLNCELNKSGFTAKTRALWNLRVHEGKSSTFWSAIEGLRECDIKFAKEVGTFCGKYEEIAGNEVLERKTEFLLTKERLCEIARQIGWKVIICEDCNTIGEAIILLQK